MTILFLEENSTNIYTAFIKDVSMYHRYENDHIKIINLLRKLIYKFNLKFFHSGNKFIWTNQTIEIHTQTNPFNGLKYTMNTNNQITASTTRVGDLGNILIMSKLDKYIDIFIDSLQEIVDDVLLEEDFEVTPESSEFYNPYPTSYFDDGIIIDM